MPSSLIPFASGYMLYQDQKSPINIVLNNQQKAFKQFTQSWNNLKQDQYLKNNGQYRLRRYSLFNYQQEKLSILPHEAHYQSLTHNALYGGYLRNYQAWETVSQHNKAFLSIVNWAISEIPTVAKVWKIQAHQFRIITTKEEVGEPTPEGVHKDGADYILIMLINKKNCFGGVSRLYKNDKQLLDQVTLEHSGDTMILNDNQVWHSVSRLFPIDNNQLAYRDVLVLTFHQEKTLF